LVDATHLGVRKQRRALFKPDSSDPSEHQRGIASDYGEENCADFFVA
jgi:hypothetical protein